MSDIPSIPGYRIEKELGQGGMATVYLAVQEKLNRRVAIKALSPLLLLDKQFSTRFLREAETAANLSHPNIVTIYDVGQTGNNFYIVMEHLSGGSLKERIARSGGMKPSDAVAVIRQIAVALDYAHREGFIHRDIKSDNILFRKDGAAVLTDFGIAKAVDSATKLTKTGMSIGTPHYMSPEQIRGQDIDGRADIYSLGAVLFEMLTGKSPYDGTDTITIAVKHIQDPVPKLAAGLSACQPLLEKMMAKAPDDRFGRCAEIIDFVAEMNGNGNVAEREKPQAAQPAVPDKESMLFEFAEKVGNPEAFAAYLADYPSGRFSDQARSRLNDADGNREKLGSVPPLTPKKAKPMPKTRFVDESEKLAILDKPPKGNLSFNFKLNGKTLVTLSGALARQGKQGVLVWEDDRYIPAVFPKAQRNTQGFWETTLSNGMEMIYVPAGEFIMGMEGPYLLENEGPVHKVWLDGYWIGKYPVNAKHFLEFANQSKEYDQKRIQELDSGGDGRNWPVTQVSYFDALDFCVWLSTKLELEFGLPTEAEWEKAARGTDARYFPWGNEDLSCKLANYSECGMKLKEIGAFPCGVSPYGAMDMCGNLWEWCLDQYDKDFYRNSPLKNPLLVNSLVSRSLHLMAIPIMSSSSNRCVLRGGAYDSAEIDISNTRRIGETPVNMLDSIGFRVAMNGGKVDTR